MGCGGWVLSRSASDTGLLDILFEFERQSCLEIYSVLIAAGLELSQGAHIRFTELCQCTRMVRKDCSDEIVSIDLEVQTSPISEAAGRFTPAATLERLTRLDQAIAALPRFNQSRPHAGTLSFGAFSWFDVCESFGLQLSQFQQCTVTN